MALRFHNTLTRTKEEFKPIQEGRVGLYTCGPTIYNFAHIGNFRAYVFEDLLRRYLEYKGLAVNHIMNLTDVEDKLIRTCRETGEPLKAVTARYAAAFFEDVKTLGILPAHAYPAATDHIPEMVEMIKDLRDKGHTYEDKGSIYFKLGTFPGYGRLSHMDLDQLRAGASGRVDADEYEAEEARDFALWKAWDENDGEVYWETELGRGRPGWHIECSAMSVKYLGPHFDIHCGGVDNIFPHHENEIAQSECCTGHTFVNYWLHCAHLVVEGRKMSKSLGNFFTLRDLLEKGLDPQAIRWVLIATHYRQPNNFSFDALDAARQSLNRIRDFRLRLEEVRGEGRHLEELCEESRNAFEREMDDDLNISGALGVVFDFVRDVNRALDGGGVGGEGAKNALALLDRLNTITGLFAPFGGEETPAEIMEKVMARQQARRDKNFALSDQLRDEVLAAGWVIEDTPKGPRVKKA
ncbi:MAG: cysteine--tRNA ligase, partial [Candidatus Hydrogenedens sp.]|nr:cysteine--tRNA ligase [Candidatus Hydrogenedentota bacterium]NLF58451.1 cysteine--tRNA ligase [Candidatus Hydrogenedens sp.]